MKVFSCSLESAIKGFFGNKAKIFDKKVCHGGCVNSAYTVQVLPYLEIFIKENSLDFPDLFQMEALGLEELRVADGPCIPKVYCLVHSQDRQFLLMEKITRGSGSFRNFEELGRSLAVLHRTKKGSLFGWNQDNYIGLTRQKNTQRSSWSDFFTQERLVFQADKAFSDGKISQSLYNRIYELTSNLKRWLPQNNQPSLLHGDLWSGNVLFDSKGSGYLIDPAVYYGDREADLAMTELFGGFPLSFYAAYTEEFPLESGYKERVSLYNLYHLLNHLNLFGESYLSGVEAITKIFIG